VVENNRTQCSGPFYTSQRGVAPPLVTTDFSCRDEGNCNPRFIRSSLYAVPTTSDLLKTVGIPFSLTVSPFARQHPDDPRILVSDMGEQGPVRCARCRGYMSPFVSFIDGGRRFQCPLCNGLTDVPEHYFAHLDHTGRRTDAYHRPELCLGSYELLATAEYCKNNELPKPPAFLFLLDVSQSAVRSGLVQLFCSSFVERILPHLPM
ncbi:Protein transport protein Sec24C, partial [Fasciolopsis buskii]